eukprot:CAMPEP_0202073376 /NCGR_PEP_ID=MMETSP0964-20121228/2997_1 /ASSEMBLY_ACC=CAM_ASM_000500 /TAXON_ID=4773 /ORGANISM="Schizochytrium aggregatum, Strain ATCC28209" /LENGTH=63 /DNA_ID=CAMNT_0048640469 /DNA_START=87 /DNA_END=275 /DNA_ORIENTATION=-
MPADVDAARALVSPRATSPPPPVTTLPSSETAMPPRGVRPHAGTDGSGATMSDAARPESVRTE